jgi:hypothetical protein
MIRLVAVDEGGRNSRALLSRQPKQDFKDMVNSGVHVVNDSIQNRVGRVQELRLQAGATGASWPGSMVTDFQMETR